MADAEDHGERLRAKTRLEARVDALIESYSSSKEKNCTRFLKRLRRERGMLVTFLEEDGVDWNNNAAERALRSAWSSGRSRTGTSLTRARTLTPC